MDSCKCWHLDTESLKSDIVMWRWRSALQQKASHHKTILGQFTSPGHAHTISCGGAQLQQSLNNIRPLCCSHVLVLLMLVFQGLVLTVIRCWHALSPQQAIHYGPLIVVGIGDIASPAEEVARYLEHVVLCTCLLCLQGMLLLHDGKIMRSLGASRAPLQLGCINSERKEKTRKDCAFWRQFDEKPSSIPGCPGASTQVKAETLLVTAKAGTHIGSHSGLYKK